MPLFHVGSDGLVPFRRVSTGVGSAQEVEASLAKALWFDLPVALSEDLFPVYNGFSSAEAPTRGFSSRNAKAGPALIALDQQANIVVICVRQTFDQNALAACLESVGWARNVTVSELAELYWRGPDIFWRAWQEFVGASGTPSVSRKPRLIVVASELATASRSALDFLLDHDLPVQVMRAGLFAGPDNSQILDVSAASRGTEATVRSRNAVANRGFDENRPPAIPQLSELGAARSPERRQQDLPPFDQAPIRNGDRARSEKFPAPEFPARPSAPASDRRDAAPTPIGPSFAGPSRKAPNPSQKAEHSPVLGPQLPGPALGPEPQEVDRPNSGPDMAPEPRRAHAQEQGAQPLQHHDTESRQEPEHRPEPPKRDDAPRQEPPARKLDPLADTLIRVQAANTARLTGTPAVDEEVPHHSHRAHAEQENEAERSGSIERPRPRPERGDKSEQPSFAQPGALGGFRAEEPGELHMVANGTNPRYRASDMGEMPPPDWD
ncbi:MAG: hypothetical protein HOQ05_12900 [Corynebacteriales bacterium]|nr:hypothetical protein [Mycobacteriales bacterium]